MESTDTGNDRRALKNVHVVSWSTSRIEDKPSDSQRNLFKTEFPSAVNGLEGSNVFFFFLLISRTGNDIQTTLASRVLCFRLESSVQVLLTISRTTFFFNYIKI